MTMCNAYSNTLVSLVSYRSYYCYILYMLVIGCLCYDLLSRWKLVLCGPQCLLRHCSNSMSIDWPLRLSSYYAYTLHYYRDWPLLSNRACRLKPSHSSSCSTTGFPYGYTMFFTPVDDGAALWRSLSVLCHTSS